VAGLSVAQNEPCTDVGGAIAGFAPGAHGGQHFQGDVDCNGSANSVDSLKILRHVAGMSNNLPAGCPAIGTSNGAGGTPTPTPVATPTPTPSSPTPTFDPSLTQCSSFGAGAAIPDNSSSGIIGTINVPESGELVDLDVCVNANHPRPDDLQLRLKHVSTGTEVVLFDGTTCGLPNVRLYFNDEAGTSNICPLDGTVGPDDPLSAFDGENVNGTWELTFADVVSGQTGSALGVTIYYEYLN
jgi:subtilisin-like proprotein convertase family protein